MNARNVFISGLLVVVMVSVVLSAGCVGNGHTSTNSTSPSSSLPVTSSTHFTSSTAVVSTTSITRSSSSTISTSESVSTSTSTSSFTFHPPVSIVPGTTYNFTRFVLTEVYTKFGTPTTTMITTSLVNVENYIVSKYYTEYINGSKALAGSQAVVPNVVQFHIMNAYQTHSNVWYIGTFPGGAGGRMLVMCPFTYSHGTLVISNCTESGTRINATFYGIWTPGG